MGQGIEGMAGDSEIPHEVFEFHRRYREFLQNGVEAYVFDNKAKIAYLIPSAGCDEEMLREYAKRVDYNLGIIHGPEDIVRKLGRYKSMDEMDHDMTDHDIQKCA